MTGTSDGAARHNTGPLGLSRAAWIIGAVLVAALAAVALFAWIDHQREADRRSDYYFCTLSGAGPLDQAPRTGERCIDLLGD